MRHALTPAFAALLAVLALAASPRPASGADAADDPPGVVHAAQLVYANHKTSVCFSANFLTVLGEETHVVTSPELTAVDSGSAELFDYPFAVMTGDGAFTLTPDQVENLRTYLTYGGFVIASSSCSNKDWIRSFQTAAAQVFPTHEMVTLDADHPIFHTVYDIRTSKYKSGGAKLPELRALELDGRVVLVWSPDGLNDTKNAAPECCCCGGNEVKSARQLNVNILAYALTH